MIAAQYGHTDTCVALLGSDKYTAVNNVENVSTIVTLTGVCVCHGMKEIKGSRCMVVVDVVCMNEVVYRLLACS